MKKEHECIIIGGGAAGMMAAITLAGYGIETCILEHTSRIGTKILQTGNGKCNFTNLNMDETMYQNKDTKWVMDVINRFNVDAVLDFFKGIGIYHKEKNGYVYPLSMTASSLQNALRLELENKKVSIHTNVIIKNVVKLSAAGTIPDIIFHLLLHIHKVYRHNIPSVGCSPSKRIWNYDRTMRNILCKMKSTFFSGI